MVTTKRTGPKKKNISTRVLSGRKRIGSKKKINQQLIFCLIKKKNDPIFYTTTCNNKVGINIEVIAFIGMIIYILYIFSPSYVLV